MGVDIADLVMKVGADTSGAQKNMSDLNSHVEKSGGFFGTASGLLKGFLGAAVGIAGVGIGFGIVKDAVGEFVDEGMNANRMTALLAAGIKSTGDASGQTMDSLDALSTHIMSLTGIQDDAVQGAEQMLLTFTNIKGSVFPEATQAAADLATRLNNGLTPSAQQLSQVSIQLGKALNDPIKGVSALQRVGVTFTDQQKEQIKAMVQAGNVAGAQKIILAELNKEFGGSAAAAGQANGGMAILQATFQKLKESVGQSLIPILTALLQNVITPITSAFASLLPNAIKTVQNAFNQFSPVLHYIWAGAHDLADVVVSNLKPGLEAMGNALHSVQGPSLNVQQVLQKVAEVMADDVGPAVDKISKFIGALLKNIAPLLPVVINLGEWLAKMIGQLVLTNLKLIGGLIQTLGSVVQSILPHLQGLWSAIQNNILPALQVVIPLVLNLAQFLGQVLLKALQVLLPIIGFVAGILADVLGAAINLVGAIIRKVAPIVGDLASWLGDHLAPVIKNVSQTLSQLHDWFANQVMPVIQKVAGFLSATLGPAFSFIAGLIKNYLGMELAALGNIIGNVVLPILGKIASFIGSVVGWEFQNLGNVIHGVTGFFGDFFNTIGNVIGGIQKLINWVGNLIDKLGKIHLPDFSGIHLPGFALGGTTPGGPVLVGEKGPEIMVPPAGTEVYPLTNSSSNPATLAATGLNRPTTVQNHIYLDGREVTRQVLRRMPEQVMLATGARS